MSYEDSGVLLKKIKNTKKLATNADIMTILATNPNFDLPLVEVFIGNVLPVATEVIVPVPSALRATNIFVGLAFLKSIGPVLPGGRSLNWNRMISIAREFVPPEGNFITLNIWLGIPNLSFITGSLYVK